MDFFAQQERARAKTKWLIFYFALAIAGIILAIYAVAMAALNYYYYKPPPPILWRGDVFLWSTVGTLLVIGAGTVLKLIELRQGGHLIASMLGGRPVNLHTTHPDERKLLNVVEEMSIASGTTMPTVYLLPDEPGINAFAAGNDRSDAVVGVTRGCMEILTRDELQGVIGHEFSHILNGDMKMNIRLIGFLHGILLIALIGRTLLRVRPSSSSKKGNGGVVFIIAMGFALMVIGYIGVFFANLIKCAVSRQREFLADAASVQFTRNPGGIAGALKKIARGGSKIQTVHAEEASHLYFAEGIGHFFESLFATHPPIEERIRAIDSDFDGKFPVLITPEYLAKSASQRAAHEAASGFSSGYIKKDPEDVIRQVGNFDATHIYHAQVLAAEIPDALKNAMRDAHGARAILFSLLLSRESEVRSRQITSLATLRDESLPAEMERIAPLVEALPRRLALPLIDLIVPALRQLSTDQYHEFCRLVEDFVAADQGIDLFEYTLGKILFRHLDIHFGKAKTPKIVYRTMLPVLPEVAILLSALAHLNGKAEDASKAFETGAANLEISPQSVLKLLPCAECDLHLVDQALDKLAQSAPFLKKNILLSCAYTVMHDGKINMDESELLRAIAETLDCPLPPMICEALNQTVSAKDL